MMRIPMRYGVPGVPYTASQIATWMVDNYHWERLEAILGREDYHEFSRHRSHMTSLVAEGVATIGQSLRAFWYKEQTVQMSILDPDEVHLYIRTECPIAEKLLAIVLEELTEPCD